jgi:hypothetical protein
MSKIAPRSAEPPAPPTSDHGLYEEDFVRWIERQVELIQAGQLTALDLNHLAEELEDMAGSQRRELRSRMETLLSHLLKYQFQPAMRTGSWNGTIAEQRGRIEDLLTQSPSLRADANKNLAEERFYKNAVRKAVFDTGLPATHFPPANPYGVEILDHDFWPGEGPHPEP